MEAGVLGGTAWGGGSLCEWRLLPLFAPFHPDCDQCSKLAGERRGCVEAVERCLKLRSNARIAP